MMHKTFLGRLFIIVCVCCTAFSPSAGRFSPAAAKAFPADPLVVEMLVQVQTEGLVAQAGSLSGEWPALVDNAQYTISTRATASGEPIQKATEYVYEHMQSLGLLPAFDDWTSWGYSGRNVIGSLPGTYLPDEIVLLTAHLDDRPYSGRAPGMDDNGSGSTALLVAADILSEYRFARTLRFVFFTGEEQGMLGSLRYAAEMRAAGENIVAVLNLDMIAWDSLGAPDLMLHIRTGSAEDLAIAEVFTNVVSAYNLELTPQIAADGHGSSDHASFWGQGYPAMLAIEDDQDDFNPFSHSTGDCLSHLNLAYFTNFVKAAVGTGAHLAVLSKASPGDYGAQVGPAEAMHWGNPAEVVPYTLQLTNTGTLTDTYQLAVSDNTWTTILPTEVGPLAAGSRTDVTVSVSVPNGAPVGMADIATLRIISEASSTQVDAAELTTVVRWKVFYLPLVQE